MNQNHYFDFLPRKEDVKNVRILVADTGVFSDEEIEIASDLVEETLEQKDSYSFVFLRNKEDNNLIGYSCYGQIPLTNKRFDLYWIAVGKKYQNKGFATLILKATEDQIKKDGGVKIYAETSSTNEYKNARSFYERLGFFKSSETADFYKDGDNKVIYCKNL